MSFQNEFRTLFARLGFPLSKRDGISAEQLVKAQNKLGIRLPHALRDYYLVAGKERVLNHSFDRLCSPSEWEIHSGKLIFMEENQTVVVWGVSLAKKPTQNPTVFQCPLVNGELDKWHSEETRCSAFLKFMIHLQAAYGGRYSRRVAANRCRFRGISVIITARWHDSITDRLVGQYPVKANEIAGALFVPSEIAVLFYFNSCQITATVKLWWSWPKRSPNPGQSGLGSGLQPWRDIELSILLLSRPCWIGRLGWSPRCRMLRRSWAGWPEKDGGCQTHMS